MIFTPDDVRIHSPKTLSLIELRNPRDLAIYRRIYAQGIRIGDKATGWEIAYSSGFHLTNDSKHFSPTEKWRATGYGPDVFDRWIGPQGDYAFPLYEGRMIGQFDLSHKGWVSGKGRTAVWREVPFEFKRIEPQYLMAEADCQQLLPQINSRLKIGIMDVAFATVTRTTFAAVNHGLPFGNSAPTLHIVGDDGPRTLILNAVLNSLTFDFAVRQRLAGLHLNWFVLEECCLPSVERANASTMPNLRRLAMDTLHLSLIHRRFAAEWLAFKALYPECEQREWKHWWAVTEADRLRLRVEIDAMCADLYGLEPDEFDWIVRDDKTDPKGFYRVDRELPFRERLTGLAGAAFRALKEGRWSPPR